MHVLHNYFTYLFLIIIIPSYASQTKIALKTDIHESMLHYLEDAHNNFLNENYTQAALSASCFISYAQGHATDGVKKRKLMPPLFKDQEALNHAHYIFAYSHLYNVSSQQIPHKSLEKICNISTPYGTLTPSSIADALHKKSCVIKTSNTGFIDQLQVAAQYYKYQAPYTYYEQALANNNDSDINAAFRQIQNISDNQSELRKCFIQIINKNFITRTSPIEKLLSLELNPSFNDTINSFLTSDGTHIMPLIKKHLSTAKNPSVYCDNLHYALGVMYYHLHDYANALLHLQKTKLYQTDLITENKVLNSFFHVNTDLSYNCACEAINIIQLMFKQKKLSRRTKEGILLKNNLLTQHAPSIAFVLTEYQDYQKALILAQLCTQHNETYQIGLDIIKFIQKSLDTTTKNYSLIITSYAYENIIQHFKNEKDLASLQLLSNIIVNHILHNNALIYDHLAIHCIEHVLQGDALSEENRTRLHAICGEFYYIQSKKTSGQSLQTEYLRNAIKHNHAEAIFEKASLYCNATYIEQNIHSQEETKESLDLFNKLKELTTENNPTNIRIKALELLANLPAHITVENNHKILIKRLDIKTKFNYMHTAYTLGSVACLSDLAFCYAQGFHCEKTFTPDDAQAYTLLKQCVETTPSAVVYSQLASVCYFRGQDYYEEALL